MLTVDVDGRTIAYRRAGTGPALVLLHGGWSDSREWRRQLEMLSDEFDVVAWDAPGCGGSSDPRPDYGMADYADDVAGLIEALELERPHLGGLSFGGGLAIAMHQRHPDLVRSLVLASAYAGWAGSLPSDEAAARLEQVRSEIDLPKEQWVESFLPGLFARPVPPEVTTEVVAIMCDARTEGVRPMSEAFAVADLRPALPGVNVPTLVIHGEADTRAPLHVAETLHQAIAGSQLRVLPGVGHCCNVEHPEAFNDAVREFLRGVS